MFEIFFERTDNKEKEKEIKIDIGKDQEKDIKMINEEIKH